MQNVTIFFIFCAALLSFPATADQLTPLSEEVSYLLARVEQTDAVFQRNGKHHAPAEAADHIRKKYEHFLKKGKIRSTEDFIRLSATRSLVSKKPYTMQFPDGRTVETGAYLLELLEAFRKDPS